MITEIAPLIQKIELTRDIEWLLNAVLGNLNWDFPSYTTAERNLELSGLKAAKKAHRAKATADYKQNQRFDTESGMITEIIGKYLVPKLKVAAGLPAATDLLVSGRVQYRPGGFMGWHTNANMPGLRIYCIWSEEAKQNFFRYEDPSTKEIITDWDHRGWTLRMFRIPATEEHFWHCLYAGSKRLAIGFWNPS